MNHSKQVLCNEAIRYRKPSVLWKEFNGLFVPLKISSGMNGTEFEKITYSRYEVGYDFTAEREHRIVTDNEGDLVHFDEQDVMAIIVPDEQSGEYISGQLKGKWGSSPEIRIYPS